MNQIRKMLLIGVATMFGLSTYAQNKVVNGSFEAINTKLKSKGQLFEENVQGWDVPSDCPPADIFSSDAKKEEVMVLQNFRGGEKPFDGEAYAGILVYSEREAEERTFVQAKFDKTLTANKTYCIKFNISLSDLSKYGVNNVGAYISSKAPKKKDIEAYEIVPQIIHSRNIVHTEQFDWITICQEFTADGTEKYITIGNFAKQDEVVTEKMRRPREFSQPQTRDAYYFIDDVSVIATSHLDAACYCEDEEDDSNQLQVVYSKNVSDEIDMDPKVSINLKKIYFESMEAKIKEEAKGVLNEIIDLLNANKAIQLQIIGHNDYIETAKSPTDLSFSRANIVKDFLVAAGVAASRIDVVAEKDTKPANKEETAKGRAQNRRVEFNAK